MFLTLEIYEFVAQAGAVVLVAMLLGGVIAGLTTHRHA